MTGAGSAQFAYATEDSFGTLPGVPTWKQPGVDPVVNSISLENNLGRRRQPDDPKPKESQEGALRGTVELEFTMASTTWHELVFANGTNDAIPDSSYLAPTATWYFDSSLLSGNLDRFLAGGAVSSVEWSYQEGDEQGVRISMTINVGAGEKDLTTPGSISQETAGDAVPFHGFQLDINGNTVNKLQSCTLSIDGLAQDRPQPAREAADMVNGAVEPSLQFAGIPENEDHLELAYGSAASAATQDSVDAVSGTITTTNDAGTLATYNLSTIQLDNYDLNNFIGEENVTETPEFHVADVSVA